MPIITGNNRFEKQVSTLGLEHVPECGAPGGAYKGYKEQMSGHPSERIHCWRGRVQGSRSGFNNSEAHRETR